MKHNQVFLRHIFDEIIFLIKETEGIKFEEFIKNEILKRACSRSLEIIGEAVKNLSPDFKKRYKEIEWKKIAGLRDKMIHGYFGVNWDIVWDVIRNQIPKLKEQVGNILDKVESQKT
ncbi:MAG: DUF86 domain-containing protein [Desulfobacterales bacterium]|jgi:uncharacterized protein with HEPN domain|nr:DUF86 domain-containing protein [Desulfobacterales bacterium]